MKTNFLRRARWVVAALAVALTVTGCKDDPTEYLAPISPEGEAVGAIRLTIGTQTMTVFKDGKVTLGPLAFLRPNAVMTATLLDAQGNPIPNVDPAKLTVNMGVSTNSQLTGFSFTRRDNFSGTLAGTTAGTGEFSVSLFDVVNRRPVFGPYFVGVVVR